MDDRRRDALKGAMLLEQRGQAFYRSAAEQTTVPEVRKLFELLAQEERHHRQTLAKVYEELERTGSFSRPSGEGTTSNAAGAVLSPEVMAEISAASYEAAAVYAAMALEERAVAYYRKQEEAATDSTERDLYRWLAEWEGRHLNTLMGMEEDLRQRIWHDQNFWPLF